MSNIPKFNNAPPIVPDRSTGDPTFSQRMQAWWAWLASFFTYLGTLVDALNDWVNAVPIAQVDDSSTAADKVLSAQRVAPHISDTGWLTPTLLNGWGLYSSSVPVRYRRTGKRVELRGLVVGGDVGSAILQFPVGFRPSHNLYFVGYLGSSDGPRGDINVRADGTVDTRVVGNDYNGISCSFLID